MENCEYLKDGIFYDRIKVGNGSGENFLGFCKHFRLKLYF